MFHSLYIESSFLHFSLPQLRSISSTFLSPSHLSADAFSANLSLFLSVALKFWLASFLFLINFWVYCVSKVDHGIYAQSNMLDPFVSFCFSFIECFWTSSLPASEMIFIDHLLYKTCSIYLFSDS